MAGKKRFSSAIKLIGHSARLVGGRRYWLAPLLTLIWPAIQAFRLQIGWRETAYEVSSVQTTLIGLPLIVLAIGLGVRIIADEIDRRTLEIAYTVPGGAHRVWLSKLAAAFLILVASEALLGFITFAFFTSVGLTALYGALQEAVFYLVLSMAYAVLTRSEITGALLSAATLCLNGLFSGFGENQARGFPTFNPLGLDRMSPEDVFAFTLQNRIIIVLLIAAIVGLAFSRAERREKLLG